MTNTSRIRKAVKEEALNIFSDTSAFNILSDLVDTIHAYFESTPGKVEHEDINLDKQSIRNAYRKHKFAAQLGDYYEVMSLTKYLEEVSKEALKKEKEVDKQLSEALKTSNIHGYIAATISGVVLALTIYTMIN